MAPWRGVFDPSLKGDVREICVRSFCACRKVTSIPHALCVYSSLSLDICPLPSSPQSGTCRPWKGTKLSLTSRKFLRVHR